MNSKQLNNYDFEENKQPKSLEGVDRIVRDFKRVLLACLLFLLIVSILAVKIQRETIDMLSGELYSEQSIITLE